MREDEGGRDKTKWDGGHSKGKETKTKQPNGNRCCFGGVVVWRVSSKIDCALNSRVIQSTKEGGCLFTGRTRKELLVEVHIRERHQEAKKHEHHHARKEEAGLDGFSVDHIGLEWG